MVHLRNGAVSNLVDYAIDSLHEIGVGKSGNPLTRGPRKRFGQHFLQDQRVTQRILAAVDPQPGDRIVEIGPGLGALTGPLLSRGGTVDVVEIDRDLAAALRESEWSRQGCLRVHLADALEFDFSSVAGAGTWLMNASVQPLVDRSATT